MGLFFTFLAEKQEVVFRQDKKFEDIAFSDDVCERLWSWILVEILKLGFVNILNFKFNRDSGFIKICVRTCDMIY